MIWDEVEERLYQAAEACLREFSKDHLTESFYSVAFACNASYGEVMFCLNTEDGLRARVTEHYPHYTPEDIEKYLRWNPGDWVYANINAEEPFAETWDGAWSETQEMIHDAWLEDDGDDVEPLFMEAACRVMIRLERNNALRWLRQEPHFAAFVTDHDEPVDDAWERLRVVRQHEEQQ